MFRKISSMKIKSVFFNPEAKIKLFEMNQQNNQVHKVSLVYGKNGTGKSTLSKATLLHDSDNDEIKMKFLDNNDQEIILDEKAKKSIHVYNEDFMEAKVKFRQNDNMETIVMLGEQVDYDLEIKDLIEEEETARKDIENLSLELYTSPQSQLNPEFHKNKLKTNLQETLGEREKNFRNMSRRPGITNDILEEAISYKFKKTKDILEKQYKSLRSKYLNIKDDNISPITIDLKDYELININVDAINNILSKRLEKPISNEISDKLKNVLQIHSMERIREMDNYFSDDENKYCPYCLRDYTDDFAKNIVKSINTLINKELKSLEIELDNLKINSIVEIKPIETVKIGIDIVNDYNKNVREFNEEANKINSILENKKSKPYEKIKMNTSITDILINLKNSYNALINKVNSINNDIKQKDKILEDLKRANKEYAFVESENQIKEYRKASQKYRKIIEEYVTLEEQVSKLNNEINRIKGLKANVIIATKMMNTWLNNIFLEKGRLSLNYNEGKYHVYCRGKPVKLKDLSNGERNAVSLTYFFAKILENSTFAELGKNPMFLVLDDPLSSFDYEYKLGILSFLRTMIDQILINEGAKVLIFTHQLDSAFSINNMLDDIKIAKGSKSCKKLINKKTYNFEKNTNIYQNLLLKIGDFIKGDTDTNMALIPNKTRRVLESFSTFNYGVGISQLTTNKDLLNDIEDENIRKYFNDNLYRINLNSGSHLAKNTFGIEEGMLMDDDDKNLILKTTKDVLLLISELNRSHFNYIFKDSEVIEIIRKHKEHINSLKET